MNALEARKRELLAASDIQRELLVLEWDVVRLQWSRIQTQVSRVDQAFQWAAPVAGLLMSRRRGRGFRSRWMMNSAKWLLLYRLWKWWRRRDRPAG